MKQQSEGMLLGLLAVSAFGLTLPATRHIVPYFDPVFIGLGRAGLAGIIAAILLVASRQPLPSRSQFVQLAVVSLGVVIGFPILSAWSLQTLPASHGGVVMGILPLLTAIIGALISDERPSWLFWLLSLTGTLLVISYAVLDGAGELLSGDLILLIAIISAAVGYAVGARLSHSIGGWQVICWALVISLPFIAIPIWHYAPSEFSGLPIDVYLSFLYLALISQLLGFFAWYKALALGGVARVSQIQLLQPFITIIAAALLLGESIDNHTILFVTLVMLTVALGKKMPIYRNNNVVSSTSKVN
jgi:drug/metabolite transporter (DMT)-like permease